MSSSPLEIVDISGEIELENAQDKEKYSLFSHRSMQNMMRMPANIQLSAPYAREWLSGRRENLKPWFTFLATSKFQVPQNPNKWTKRVVANIEYFASNYMFVFLGLIIYCLVTSPLLLFAIAANLGGCYIVSLKNAERKLSIGGKEIAVAHQYAAVGLLSLPIFYFAGATTAIFWVIGASFFVIMLHASFFNLESIVQSDEEPFELQLEEVV